MRETLTRSAPERSRDAVAEAMAAEQVLVARARRGDHGAFRQLVEQYEGLVAGTVIGMMGPGPEADDVGQRVFIRFYRALDQYRGEGGVAPYLTRIAVNLSLNALDRRQRQQKRLVSRDGEAPLPEQPGQDERDLQAFDREEVVHQALQQLSEKHRAVVVLRLVEGYSTRETAEMLDVPQGTVLSRLYRAQRKLREILKPYLEDR